MNSSDSMVLRIMRKAVSLPFENQELMVRAFIVIFLPFVILVLLHYVIATPFLAKVEDDYENSLLSYRDVISLVIIEVPFVASFCFLVLFSSATAIFVSVSTHQGTGGHLKEVLLSIKSTWKSTLVSGLYILLMMIGFLGFTIGLCLTRVSTLAVIVAALLAYPYLASISTLVLVISTLEYECFGILQVFNQAWEIIRENKFNSYFLMLALLLLGAPVNIIFYVTSTDDDDENSLVMQFGFLLVSTVLFCLMSFYSSIAYTFFYLDYKQRNSEKIEELQSRYQPVPSVVTDTDLWE